MLGGEAVGVLPVLRLEAQDVGLEVDGLAMGHELLVDPVLVGLFVPAGAGPELGREGELPLVHCLLLRQESAVAAGDGHGHAG